METLKHSTKRAPGPCIGMLCDVCKRTISRIQDSLSGSHRGPEPQLFAYAGRNKTWRGAHHIQDGSFLAALDRRCYICYTLHQACSIEARKHAEFFRTFYEICPEGADRYTLQMAIEIRHDGPSMGTESQVIEPYGAFKIIPKTAVPNVHGCLGLTENTFDGKCENQIKDWLVECTKNHTDCNDDWRTSVAHPVRLLRVGHKSDRYVSLETFPSGTGSIRYVTMSHCWDHEQETQPLTLTKENSQRLENDFLMTELQQKFQDAIEIARWMEVEYLWIDALCIVQDSREDWRQQSRFMGDIYAGSYCNIAATNADGNKGCFRDRPVEIVEPYFVPNPKLMSSSSTETHVIGYDDFWCNSLLDSVLHTRAWVLQERLLSPRTIHFGKEQMFWECRKHKACEAYPTGIPSEFSNRRTREWRQGEQLLKPKSKELQNNETQQSITTSVLRFLRLMPPKPINPTEQIYNFWSTTVERYMECNLSFPSDKLVAIAGIANQVKEITKERYLAGLWENERLPQSLLWYVPVRRQANDKPSIKSPSLGRAGYRAPSWSWASLDARIVWHWPSQCDRVLINVEHTNIETLEDGASAVKSAGMRIRGHLFSVQLQIMHRNEDGSLDEDGSYALVPKQESVATKSESMAELRSSMESTVYLDEALSPKPKADVYLLPVSTKWQDRNGHVIAAIAGLILKKSVVLKRTVYERIGVFGLDEFQTGIVGDIQHRKHGTEADLASTESFMLI